MIIQPPKNSLECIDLSITDDLLANAQIVAYMCNQRFHDSRGKLKPFSPKSFPDRAVDIIVPVDDTLIEIYLNPKTFLWDSKFKWNNTFGKLTPEQMDQFFSTQFYAKTIQTLKDKWPLKDPIYQKLFIAAASKKVNQQMSEEDIIEAEKIEQEKLDEVDQPGKRVDLARKDVTGDNKIDYSGSGRKIIHFQDQGVSIKSCQYYCWPRKGKEWKWNTWSNWEKQKPFAKMYFKYNGRKYMISLSLFDENFDHRGFRGADCDWTPPFAWLTPTECDEVMHLSVVKKFLRQCEKKINTYLSMTPEEIYEKIPKKDKVTQDQIAKTLRVIRHVLNSVFKEKQADDFITK